MRHWFITGISRGLGLAIARAALARGDRVIGTARGSVPLQGADGQLEVISVDMADEAATIAAVHSAFASLGRIDVIVNNAGFGVLGAVEHSTDVEMRDLFEVNVFAPIRIIRTALPYLRAQGQGHIINITSIAARAPGTGSGLYAATKFALEGLSVSLAQEVAPFGIKVTAVAPGQFRTEFLSGNSLRISKGEGDYTATVGSSLQGLDERKHSQLGDPDRAADVIVQAVEAELAPLHLLLGSDALERAKLKSNAMSEEIALWEARSRSTDFATAD